jgi:hypothetical protein
MSMCDDVRNGVKEGEKTFLHPLFHVPIWFMKHDRNKPRIAFNPVPLRARHDGWTAEKQIAFIEALAETGCVEEACRRVGMSDSAAYKLRLRPCGAPFRRAWDAALDYSLHRLEHAVFDRSLNGVPRPVFYKGEQVGEWRHFDERLTMFLLRTRRPDRYGKWIERMLAPEGDDDEPDPAVRLDGGIERIAWEAEELRGDDEEEEGE